MNHLKQIITTFREVYGKTAFDNAVFEVIGKPEPDKIYIPRKEFGINDITTTDIVNAVTRLGYELKENYPNIIGVRNDEINHSIFNDKLYVLIIKNGKPQAYVTDITTDPSVIYLKKPVNSKGAAALVPGQYKDAYVIGIHRAGTKSEHRALVQRGAKVAVYRDNDKNNKHSYDSNTVEWGYFGINIHRPTLMDSFEEVLRYSSAGCQVFADRKEHSKFMNVIDSYPNIKSFNYTLLTLKQIKYAKANI